MSSDRVEPFPSGAHISTIGSPLFGLASKIAPFEVSSKIDWPIGLQNADAARGSAIPFVSFAPAGDAFFGLEFAALARRRPHHDFHVIRPAFLPIGVPGIAFDLGWAAEELDGRRHLVRMGPEMGRVIIPPVTEGSVRLQPVAQRRAESRVRRIDAGEFCLAGIERLRSEAEVIVIGVERATRVFRRIRAPGRSRHRGRNHAASR